MDKGVNVLSLLCTGKVKEMKSAREALYVVITTLPNSSGVSNSWSSNENSNDRGLLEILAEDNSDLRSWWQRTKYKWLSHDIVNELALLCPRTLAKFSNITEEISIFLHNYG